MVSCFLVRCWFFEGLAEQHKSEGPRPHFASSPTLGVANLLLVDFIVCFGPVVPLENHVNKHGKIEVSLEEACGAWDTD